MPPHALRALCALAGVLAGYAAATAYAHHRARDRDLAARLIRAGDAHHLTVLRAHLAQRRADDDVLAAAATAVDAAYARLTHDPQEGGPHP